jgi:SnoaL-like domain
MPDDADTAPVLGGADPQISALEQRVQALEDLEDTRRLMARYHRECDGWDEHGTHKDPAAIAALFTPDGVWDETVRQPPPTGRAQIEEFARELRSVDWVVHYVTNPTVRIDVDGNEATGEFDGILNVKLRPGSPLVWVIGIYRITAVRSDGGWQLRSLTWEPITHRRYDPDR